MSGPASSARTPSPACRRVLGDDHPYTLLSATNLAVTLGELGQYEQARQLGEDTLTRCAGSWATTTPTPCAWPPISPLPGPVWG